MHYLKGTPDSEFCGSGTFGRKLSVGTPMFLRPDKTSQCINMESIFRLSRFGQYNQIRRDIGELVFLNESITNVGTQTSRKVIWPRTVTESTSLIRVLDPWSNTRNAADAEE